ncbi:MAG TPA: PRTRC system ThiF family protein [Hanamia sp.]|nr:PRTRC system ThiF family protein [Hanamia sp.]
MKVHFTEPYLLNPPHQVTIDLIGMGGTGSQVLTNLGRLHSTLINLGHPGLHVRCWDDDVVSASNIGRQLFSFADLHTNKAIILVSRLNSFYGTDWQAIPEKFEPVLPKELSNITITCVDTAAARIEIDHLLKPMNSANNNDSHFTNKPFYWLDLGNLQKTGQLILGTVGKIKQPHSENYEPVGSLANVIKKFPEIKKIKEKDQGPSCSLAEAIKKQDLFINSTLATFGADLLWKLFREGMLTYHGAYINLNSFTVNPIKI